MLYKSYYNSPIGELLLVSKDNNLIGLYLKNQKYYLSNIKDNLQLKDDLPIFKKTKDWLNRYFNNKNPSISELSLSPIGSPFAKEVWHLLCDIPYGKITTYKELAIKIKEKLNKPNMSAQAIGYAVSHNPILIIIPCHRVVGTSGNLTGYAAGIDNKEKLLRHEQVDLTKLFKPKVK